MRSRWMSGAAPHRFIVIRPLRPKVDIDLGIGRRCYDDMVRNHRTGFIRGEGEPQQVPRPLCHPDRPLRALLMCNACYVKWQRRKYELERETDIKFGHLRVLGWDSEA